VLLVLHGCQGGAISYAASLTIDAPDAPQHTYRAFCVAWAQVDEHGRASHVRWPSEQMQRAVLGFLDAQGYEAWLAEQGMPQGLHDTAQASIAYIAQRMGQGEDERTRAEEAPLGSMATQHGDEESSEPGETLTPSHGEPASNAFAAALARSIAQDEGLDYRTCHAGEQVELEEGYWLFVSEDSSQAGDAGTAPLWVACGGSHTHVQEKRSLPTLDKRVRDERGERWSTTREAAIGEALDYRIQCHLPESLGSYEHYHLRIEDTMDDGLDLVLHEDGGLESSVSILVGGTELAVDGRRVALSYEDHMLVIDFHDLCDASWQDVDLFGETIVQVSYQARLNDRARTGERGNDNRAVLHYSNNPVSTQESTTTPVLARVFTYRLRLHKYGAEDGTPLAGARFSLRRKDGTPLLAHDSTEDLERVLTTGEDGSVELVGLSDGTYLIEEVQAPTGYERDSRTMRLEITSDEEEKDHTLSRLEGTASNGAVVSDVDISEGRVDVRMENARLPNDPSTPDNEPPEGEPDSPGQIPQTGVVPLGSLLLVGGAALARIARPDGTARRASPRHHARRQKPNPR
jgi:fimbrial isopeptide formation D2 family protein